jgi:Peptidase family M23
VRLLGVSIKRGVTDRRRARPRAPEGGLTPLGADARNGAPGSYPDPEAPSDLSRGSRFSLVLVRGDGARVFRLSFSRRLPILLLAGIALTAAALVAVAGDWWLSRGKFREVGGLQEIVTAQRSTIAALESRMGEAQTEIASWRELHARIWEPFGPDAAPKGRRTGIGGPSVASGSALPDRLAPRDDAERLTEAVREEGENLRALERLISGAGRALASLPSRWPVRGTVNSEFGARRAAKGSEFHGGIDIGAERGTPVHAPAAGTVTFAGAHAEYGLSVTLDHGEDLRTIYGHLSKITVAVGEKVQRGAQLGFTGNTGRSSGPHLHYEILVKDRPVNPRAYFWN